MMNNDERNVWTTGEIVSGKTLQVAIMTVIICVILTKAANFLLTILINIGNTAVGVTSIAHLGIFSVVLLIPAFFITIPILKFYFNRGKLPEQTDEVKNSQVKNEDEVSEKDTKFKWHLIYSLALGYIVLIITIFIGRGVGNSMMNQASELPDVSGQAILLYLGALIVSVILPIVFAIIFTRILNKFMIKITKTNQDLLGKMKNGYCLENIPTRYRNQKDIMGIVKILENGEALSLNGAVRLYRIKVVIYKICKSCAIIGIIFGAIITLITMGSINTVSSEIEGNIRGFGGNSGQNSGSVRNNDDKWFKAKKAKEKAYFDQSQANKAANYNQNSYDAYSKQNYANESWRQAEKINREKYE